MSMNIVPTRTSSTLRPKSAAFLVAGMMAGAAMSLIPTKADAATMCNVSSESEVVAPHSRPQTRAYTTDGQRDFFPNELVYDKICGHRLTTPVAFVEGGMVLIGNRREDMEFALIKPKHPNVDQTVCIPMSPKGEADCNRLNDVRIVRTTDFGVK